MGAGPGIVIQQFQTTAGPVDYALFANRKAVGVVVNEFFNKKDKLLI